MLTPLFLTLTFSLIPFIFTSSNTSNHRPIIGILAQPSDFNATHPTDNYSYIASSYVKFVESSGARVVPIPYDLSYEELKEIFQSINGLLFPGGSASLWKNESTRLEMSEFTKKGQYLVNLAIEANLNGNYFPIWGTCLGYELILISITNDPTILSLYNSSNHRLTLSLKNIKYSRMFDKIDERLKSFVQNHDISYFNHHYGMDVNNFLRNGILSQLFTITSTAKTENGSEFISSIEGLKLPLYGVQFHPEKSPFEWRTTVNASHIEEAVKISQEYANFFNKEARKNNHRFFNETFEEKHLIYNYKPEKVHESFMECYFFYKNITRTEGILKVVEIP